jgi:RNA polymerase sigma-70 factor (ECF subfamily)
VSSESFDNLIARLRQGDQDACALTFKRYIQRLAALARVQLSTRLRQKLDPEDVTQSAFRTFFRGMKENRFRFRGWDDLWTILALLTLRKCGHQVEHFQAARRDVGREVRAVTLSQDSSASWLRIAREPPPDEAAMLAETIEQILVKLKESERSIFLLSLQGLSVQEISAKVDRSERTVYRVLEYVKRELQRSP